MSGKRKESPQVITGREKKKQKTAVARTIAVQPSTSGSSNAAPGPSRLVHFQNDNPLPGSLDVEKFAEARAFEINAMHNAMETARAGTTHRAWQQLPRHLRRRAASHDVRRVPLRLRDKARAEMDVPRPKPKKHIPQRGKAKRKSKAEIFLKRQHDKVWLETHVWHAKRMHMENMWGYRLAVTPTEKSFRPSHRASVHGSILHDASYLGLIEMKGPEYILRSILDRCTDCHGPSAGAQRFLTGARACDTHLYKRDAYPMDLIAPAKILWRPLGARTTSDSSQHSDDQEVSSTKQQPKGKGKATADRMADQQRTIWIWVHPSICDEVIEELRTCISLALETAKKSNPSARIVEVELADLRQELNVFEIMGPKASQVIRGALKPVGQDSREDFKKCWSSLADLQSVGSVPRNTVIGFKVLDPRLNYPPKNAKVAVNSSDGPSLSAAGTNFYPTSSLAQSDIWDENVRRPLLKPKFKKSQIDRRRSKNLDPGTPAEVQQADDRVPVLMIQHSVENCSSQTPNSPFSNATSLHGWTLIIPAGWSMAFLPSLIHTGTRVGGQRERQTQAFESSMPFFPRDYPSTDAYSDFAANVGTLEKERWDKKPKAKRPAWDKLGVRSPWKPDWDVVLGLKEPQPFTPTVGTDEDLLPTDRPEHPVAAESLPTAQRHGGPDWEWEELDDEDHQDICHPWLLRGTGVTALLISLASPASTHVSRLGALMQFIDTPRTKRNIPFLAAQTSGPDDSPRMSPEQTYQSALVRVALRLWGRGCPSDMAIIHEMTDEELMTFMQTTASQKGADLMQVDLDEPEQSAAIPPQETIIGYVTTGSYSLSLGEGSAIGALPLSRFVDLQLQAKRLGFATITVKVRDRHETICREAKLLVMED